LPLDTIVNFTLLYRISASLSAAYLSTAEGPASSALLITSYAPSPETTCVNVTDSRTSLASAASHVSTNPDGSSVWSYALSLTQGTTEGNYALSFSAADCPSGTRLTTVGTAPYVVDNTPPVIDPLSLVPLDHGNTLFPSGPVAARATDAAGGSGVEAASIAFTLTDEADPANPRQFTGSAVSYSAGWAKTHADLGLEAGHDYQIVLEVADRAGNRVSRNWESRSVPLPAIDDTLATLAARGTNSGKGGSAPGTTVWEFNPGLTLADRWVHFSHGSAHAGFGTVASSVPVGAAKVRIVWNGVTQQWISDPYPPNTMKTVYQQVAYTSTTGAARDVRVVGSTVWLPTLTMDLPLGTTSAELALTDVSTSADPAGVCPDPTVGPVGCTQDPLRFFVPDHLALLANKPGAGTGFEAVTDDSILFGVDRLVPDPTLADDGGIWQSLNPLGQFACGPSSYAPIETCLVDGVLYDSKTRVVPPSAYANFCGQAAFCTRAQAEQASVGNKSKCVDHQFGFDKPAQCGPNGCSGEGSEWCNQMTGMTVWQTGAFMSESSDRPNDLFHVFQAKWIADWGYEDGPYDDLGIHWSTQKKDMRWKIARPADIQGLGFPRSASVLGSYDVGIYPQSLNGQPTAAAYNTWERCFAAPGNGFVGGSKREFADERTGVATGAGTGSAGSSTAGWPQYKHWGPCGSGTTDVYLRAEEASLYAIVAQDDFFGSQMQDGHMLGTHGHLVRPVSFSWDFAATVACELATGGGPACNALGIIFNLATQDQTDDQQRYTDRLEHANAFNYS
jgi:hypothetical protein